MVTRRMIQESPADARTRAGMVSALGRVPGLSGDSSRGDAPVLHRWEAGDTKTVGPGRTPGDSRAVASADSADLQQHVNSVL